LSNNYSAKEIKVLEGLKAVRKRPGMYIGSTGTRGLHHLIWEIVDNSIDEFLAGHGDKIEITLHKDGSISVRDYARGIPVDKHPKKGVSAAQLVLTTLHAGGKFDGKGYKVSGGLHGVGVSVVNALSEWLELNIYKNGNRYNQKYEEGVPIKKFENKGKANKSLKTGTHIRFKPDSKIFDTVEFKHKTIKDRLKQSAFLNKGLKIIFKNKIKEKTEEFQFEGGIKEYVKYINEEKNTIGDVFYIEKETENNHIEVAFQYRKGNNENIKSFANNIYTENGGYHTTGFKSALTRVMKQIADEYSMIKKSDPNIKGRDIRAGITAVVSVKLPDPQFEGQTKGKLGNSEINKIVSQAISDELTILFQKENRTVKTIINKAIRSAKAREVAKKTREISKENNIFKNSKLPGKLASCSSRDPKKKELFLVEGDSAGGSAKQGRNRETQAILPLKGKVLNVERANMKRILKNKEITSIIKALGVGIGDEFSFEDLRYHKVIIMTDADVDGAHITTLLLTLFYRYFPELIEQEMLYVAQSPLYKLQRGKEKHYLYSDQELKSFENKERYSIQRYKGLGEMNPKQLWETTMDPTNRKLQKIEVENAEEANKVFKTLMGSKVKPRRQFIQRNAEMVDNIDI